MPEPSKPDTSDDANTSESKPKAEAVETQESKAKAEDPEPTKASQTQESKAEAVKSEAEDSEPKAKAAKEDKESKAIASKPEDEADSEPEKEIVEAGKISQWLTQNGFEHEFLGRDHEGVEILKVDREFLIPFATALYAYGFNYLRCQGGYDVGAGEDLVSVYDLTKLSDNADRPEEVRVKVFLPRADPKIASVYWIWKTADFQERETYDMYGIVYEGHPNLKRLLMPEDWVGWPLRKDYISPDFYELQDAY